MPPSRAMPLRDVSEPLASLYDVALLDLDGVVYLGGSPIPGAADALAKATAAGMRLAFVTNNASRTPSAVAAQLVHWGLGLLLAAASVLLARPALGNRAAWLAGGIVLAVPGVTNDFISLLKDSSLVSVLTVVELTKRMTITAVDTRGWIVPGALCAALYFALGYPFTRLARHLERRLGAHGSE